MSIEIQSRVPGRVWQTRNRLANWNVGLPREEVIGAARVYVQRWHGYEAVASPQLPSIRIFDTQIDREIDARDESCEPYRAVKLVHGPN
jgi:hypothetical protein